MPHADQCLPHAVWIHVEGPSFGRCYITDMLQASCVLLAESIGTSCPVAPYHSASSIPYHSAPNVTIQVPLDARLPGRDHFRPRHGPRSRRTGHSVTAVAPGDRRSGEQC